MSSTNYDVEKNITYNINKSHYIPTYKVSFPYYFGYYSEYFERWYCDYEGYISFDEEGEEKCEAKSVGNAAVFTLSASGIYNKIYFRNPYRGVVTFKPSNCSLQIIYNIKGFLLIFVQSRSVLIG